MSATSHLKMTTSDSDITTSDSKMTTNECKTEVKIAEPSQNDANKYHRVLVFDSEPVVSWIADAPEIVTIVLSPKYPWQVPNVFSFRVGF